MLAPGKKERKPPSSLVHFPVLSQLPHKPFCGGPIDGKDRGAKS